MKFTAILDRHRLALLACLALAAILRFVNLDEAVTWEDEAVAFHTVQSGTSVEIIREMVATDATRAPLHPLLLHGWLGLFGTSLLAGRTLSAVCGLAAVGLVYVLGRQAFDRSTALLACGLAAVNPLDVHHSREIRMYECVVLVTCACWALLFSFRRSAGVGRQVAYMLAMTALVYLHPLGGLMVIALAVGYLAMRPGMQLGWKSWMGTQIGLAAMLAPWAYRYLDHGPQEFPRAITARLVLEWPEGFTGGNAEAAWAGAALVIAGIVASRRKGEAIGTTGRAPIDRTSAALIAWFLVPPALLLTYSLTRHPIFGERRYLLYVGPAYLILAARGLAALPTRPRVAVLLAFFYFNVQALDRRVYHICRPDLRTAARIAEADDPSAPIVVVDNNRNGLYKCMLPYKNPSLPAQVFPVRRVLEAMEKLHAPPAPVVWFAIERPKGMPWKPIPERLSRLYVTERTIELPYLTLTYNRLAGSATAASPVRR